MSFHFELNNTSYEFVKIPAGEFDMGDNNGLPIEQPITKRHIDKDLYVLATPVTQRLYEAVCESNPSEDIGDELPVVNVNWFEANTFCELLGNHINKPVRLPTETEWEYFCRANTTGQYFFNEQENRLHEFAWYDMNALDKPHPAKQKQANPWGLYDVIGNVWEWCSSEFTSDYHPDIKPTNKRAIRGGAYDMDDYRLRSAYRSSEHPEMRIKKIGFRVVF